VPPQASPSSRDEHNLALDRLPGVRPKVVQPSYDGKDDCSKEATPEECLKHSLHRPWYFEKRANAPVLGG
jgi:hypothetical protein